jgi:hypothetical protein
MLLDYAFDLSFATRQALLRDDRRFLATGDSVNCIRDKREKRIQHRHMSQFFESTP